MNVIDCLKGVQKQANGWIAKCPAHDDGHASLSVSHRDGNWLLHCHAGCSFEAIVAALGIKLSDLFDPETRKSKPNGKAFIAEYIYRAANGELSRKVCRTGDKQFPQFRWTGSDWQAGTKGTPFLPYRLPELTKAGPETPIFICEGEKDCDRLASLGFVATTNPMGAGKWQADLNEYFRDRLVYILPDNDEPGCAHAQHVARNLDKIAASIRVVPLPGLEPKGDVSDWLKTDPTGARLVRECKAAPLWEPTTAEATADDGSYDKVIAELAALSEFAYQKCRRDKAKGLGISLSALDYGEAPSRNRG
jgi:putative DNA primase/helicase